MALYNQERRNEEQGERIFIERPRMYILKKIPKTMRKEKVFVACASFSRRFVKASGDKFLLVPCRCAENHHTVLNDRSDGE